MCAYVWFNCVVVFVYVHRLNLLVCVCACVCVCMYMCMCMCMCVQVLPPLLLGLCHLQGQLTIVQTSVILPSVHSVITVCGRVCVRVYLFHGGLVVVGYCAFLFISVSLNL